MTILSVLIVLSLRTGSPQEAAAARWQESGSPIFGLETVTDESLDLSRIQAALPAEFSSFLLNTEEIPGFTHARPDGWASSTTNFAYYDPLTPVEQPGLIVSVSRLKEGWSLTESFTAMREAASSELVNYSIEDADAIAAGSVQYVLANGIDRLGTARHFLQWGSTTGVWLFEVQADSPANREVFARTLVRSLTSQAALDEGVEEPRLGPVDTTKTPAVASPEPGTTATAGAAETASAIPSATATTAPPPTETLAPTVTSAPTVTPRPTSTSVPTATPPPTQTPRPRPTATPTEREAVESAEAAAIDCLERDELACPVRLFKTALERYPENEQLQEDLYASLVIYGTYWEEAENIDQARQQYQEAFELDPTRYEASEALDRLRPYSRILRGDGLRRDNELYGTGTNEFADFYYANDSLVIRAKNRDGGSYTFSETEGLERTSIAVSFAVVEYGDGFAFLDYQDPSTGGSYSLQILTDTSQWTLRYFPSSGEYQDLIPWTDIETFPGEGLWTMELRLVDGILYALVNGDFVGSIDAPSFTEGSVSFGCGLFTDSYSETYAVAFNRLRIYQIA